MTIQAGVAKRIIRVKNSLDRIASHKYCELSFDYIINYIGWLHKYNKAPKSIIDKLVEYVIAIQDGDDEKTDNFILNYDIKKELNSLNNQNKLQ